MNWYSLETLGDMVYQGRVILSPEDLVRHLNLAFEKGKHIGSGGTDAAISQLEQRCEHEYQEGWNDCAARAQKICENRASVEDRHFAIRAEASKCGIAIEHWCIKQPSKWGPMPREISNEANR